MSRLNYTEMFNLARLLERELSALQASVEATEKDAARYRWLRDADITDPEALQTLQGDELDAAIDAAVAEERET